MSIEETLKQARNFLIIPAAMGTAFYIQKTIPGLKSWQRVSIVGGAGLVGWGVKYLLTKPNRVPVDMSQIPAVGVDPISGTAIQWDPDPLAREAKENWQGWNLYQYPETADKILNLNPNQLKLLYNHYNTYYADGNETLTQLIAGEWSD